MTRREAGASPFDPNPPPDVTDEDVPSDPAVVPESGLSLSELLGEIQWPMVPGWAAGQAPDEATGRTGDARGRTGDATGRTGDATGRTGDARGRTGDDQAPNDSAAD